MNIYWKLMFYCLMLFDSEILLYSILSFYLPVVLVPSWSPGEGSDRMSWNLSAPSGIASSMICTSTNLCLSPSTKWSIWVDRGVFSLTTVCHYISVMTLSHLGHGISRGAKSRATVLALDLLALIQKASSVHLLLLDERQNVFKNLKQVQLPLT